MRLVRGRLWVALLAIILTLALAGTVSAATVAATASVTPQTQYLGDTTGTAFTFTINNTGTASIGAVEIRRPSNAWAIVGCPQAPAGWTAQQSTIMCRYRSADGAADDIQPGQSVSTFTVKATTQGGTQNRSGTWLVNVSETNRFDSPSQAGATPATPNSLTVTVYSWQILDAVVSSSSAAVGSACPAPNKEADGGSTQTIVICGRNRTTSTGTPLAAHASLGGTFIDESGTFSSGPVAPGAASVVLGNWSGAKITSNAGPGKTIEAAVGSAANQTSPLTTLTGYEVLNFPPEAANDTGSANEGGPAITIDVLANDSDADNDPLTVDSVDTTGTTGVVTNNGDDVTYDPNGQFESLGAGDTDTDSFGYTVSDGEGGSDTATVVVTIHGQNDAPIAGDDTYGLEEGATLSGAAPGVLVNDTDADAGDSLQALLVTGPAHASAFTLNPDGSFSYTHDGGPTTADSFTYKANDGSADSNVATVSLVISAVGDAPVAVDDAATVAEDAAATPIDVLANDSDEENEPFSIDSASDPANGTVVITNNGADLTYQPDANYCNDGSPLDTFTYTLTPGGLSATVSVTVTCVNDNPVATDDAATVTEDAPATTIDVLANDSDVEGNAFSIASVTQPANGAVVITNSGANLTYKPDANECNDGSPLDTFTYTLTPGGATATVSVTVECVDDASVAVNDTKTVAEDAGPTTIDVLANDTDVEGDTLTIETVTQSAHGTVFNNGSSVTYVPNDDYCNTNPGGSPDTFTYTLEGGSTATVSVTVTCVDDDPEAVDDAATVAEDAAATPIDVLANDTDSDGGPGIVGSVTQPANGSVVITNGGMDLTYQPDANYCNDGSPTDDFEYTLTPGGDIGVVEVTVTCVNDAPTAQNHNFGTAVNHTLFAVGATGSGPRVEVSGSVLTGASDVDGPGSVTAVAGTISSANGGTVQLNADGSFTYISAVNFRGTSDSFSYKAKDGANAESAPKTVTIALAGTVVWYVDNAQATNGDGRSTSPFNALAPLSTGGSADGQDTSGDVIYVHQGSGAYGGGIVLENGQHLTGQGVALQVGASTLHAAGSDPTITNGGGAGITAAQNNTIKGLTVGDTTGGDLVGTSVGGLVVRDVTLAGAGQAVNLNGGTVDVILDSLSVTSSTGGAITLVNVAGTFTANAGSIAGAAGTDVLVDGGNAAVTYAGSVTNSAGRSVQVEDRTGGSVTLSGALADTGTGILVQNNNAGTVAFTGSAKTLNTGTNQAVTLSNNVGATVNFTGGGLAINTTSAVGFGASGGGTVNVAGSGNTIASTTGTALNVANTTIGSSGLTFRSISANGAASGIVLDTTGTSGGLTVTGAGTANSGGTIQNTTGHAVSLTATRDVSLDRMNVQNSAGSGIWGTGVTNFSFTNGTVNNSGTGGGSQDSNIAFNVQTGTGNNLAGNVTITGNTLTNALWHGVSISNLAGTIADANISNNTITASGSTASSLGSGIQVAATGSATAAASLTKATVSGNTINNFASGAGVQIQGGNATAGGPQVTMGTPGSSTDVISIANNVIGNASVTGGIGTNAIAAGVTGTAQGKFSITNNGTAGVPLQHFKGIGIAAFGGNHANVVHIVHDNVIDATDNLFGSSGLSVGSQLGVGQTGTIEASIKNNTISGMEGNGILAGVTNSNNSGFFIVQNNTVGAPQAGVRPGIRVESGSGAGDTTVCADISGNTSAGSGGIQGIGVRKQGTTATVNDYGIVGLVPSPATGPQAATYVAVQNPLGGGAVSISGSNYVSCAAFTVD